MERFPLPEQTGSVFSRISERAFVDPVLRAAGLRFVPGKQRWGDYHPLCDMATQLKANRPAPRGYRGGSNDDPPPSVVDRPQSKNRPPRRTGTGEASCDVARKPTLDVARLRDEAVDLIRKESVGAGAAP